MLTEAEFDRNADELARYLAAEEARKAAKVVKAAKRAEALQLAELTRLNPGRTVAELVRNYRYAVQNRTFWERGGTYGDGMDEAARLEEFYALAALLRGVELAAAK